MSSNESNVRVVIRIRPLSPKERLSSARACLTTMDGNSIICPPDKTFSYDFVLEPTSSQADVFDKTVAPFINEFLQGFNCSVLAYGQTGSGKTHTMGTMSTTDGIIPRTINRIIRGIREDRRVRTADIYVSFAEIYNEEVNDLLDPRTGKKIGIREDTTGDIVLTGVKEERIPIVGESEETPARAILSLLHQGALGRTTKSTAMNLQSSRSHAIFTLTLRQTQEASTQLVSKLNFVDLAGSERMKRTGAEGDRAKESISINSGLLALGNVISALSDPNKRNLHIPYRDSKLTRLLQDSLGGNSKTVMIACVSPADIDLNETINTLRYAQRARHIKNRAQINTELPGSTATMFEVLQLRRQVAALKSELLHARGGNDAEAQRLERENAELRRKAGSQQHTPLNIPRISEQKATIRRGFESIDAIAAQISSLQLDLQDEGTCNVRLQCETLLSRLRSELSTQEETLAKLQALSQEYDVMRSRFEERLLLQQEALTAAQRERDEALSRISDPTPLDSLSRMTRQKYEDKIQRLGREVNDSRRQLSESQERLSMRANANDRSVYNLKQTVQALRSEKQQFQDRMEELEHIVRQGESTRDGDIREARLRERKASDQAKRWKRAYEFQKSLLLKRSEQCSIARNKVQTLLTVLRRKSLKSPSISRVIDLNSPSWRKLMASDADIPGRFEDDRPSSPTRKSTKDSVDEDEDVPMTFVSSSEIVEEGKPTGLLLRRGGSLSKLQ